MVTPIATRKIIKKRRTPFIRHESDRRATVKANWRKPKGIDNCVRRRFRGSRLMPKIGYGSAKATRHMCPNGFYKILVFNEKELDMLMMQNRKFQAEVAHAVSARKRQLILSRAKQLNIKVTNGHAKFRSEEKE